MLLSAGLWIFALGNLAGLVWIVAQGGGDGIGLHWDSLTNFLLGMGRLTAFLAGYAALIEVLLLARLPFLERIVGFDRLTFWHRWNGHTVIYLAIAHVFFSVWGYARQDGHGWLTEYWNWLTLPQPSSPPKIGGGIGSSSLSSGSLGSSSLSIGSTATSPYPGIITATIGTFLLVLVLVTSLVVVRRKLSYEWWYAVHFTAYAGIALAWFHMIPDGNELIIDHVAADYWRALFALTLAVVLWYARRHRLPVLALCDLYAAGGFLGESFGRIGCFSAGDDYGRPAPGLPWAVRFTDPASEVPPELRGIPLHPTQLYLWALAFGIFLVARALERRKRFDGQPAAVALVLYALGRSVIELYRGDADRGFVLHAPIEISSSQFLSPFCFLAGVILWWWGARKQATHPA